MGKVTYTDWFSHKSPTDLAWAAGFIDGEGCIAITRSMTRKSRSVVFSLRLMVANTDRRSLDRLMEIFGFGSVYQRNEVNRWKTCWVWTVMSRQAAGILASVFPYLVVKKEQAQLAIEFQGIPTARNCKGAVSTDVLMHRERIWQEIGALKESTTGSKRKREYDSYQGIRMLLERPAEYLS